MKLPKLNLNRGLSFKVHIRGWLVACLIIGMTLVFLSHLIRVVVNAADNFEVYLYEQSSVAELRSENEALQRELAYYNSYEYKKLYARDYLHLVEPGERLYKIVGAPKYYDLKKAEVELFREGQMLPWWLKII